MNQEFVVFVITYIHNLRYLFGEEVDGVAFVVFGILYSDNKKSIPGSLQRVQVRTLLHHLNRQCHPCKTTNKKENPSIPCTY